jgi:hypothetical protein
MGTYFILGLFGQSQTDKRILKVGDFAERGSGVSYIFVLLKYLVKLIPNY